MNEFDDFESLDADGLEATDVAELERILAERAMADALQGLEQPVDHSRELFDDPRSRWERPYEIEATHRPALLPQAAYEQVQPVLHPPAVPSAAEVALRAIDARERILATVADFGHEAQSAARAVLAGTPAEALVHPVAADLIANFAIGEAAKRGRLASVSGPRGASNSLSSGASSFGSMGAFESVFGNGRLSAEERAELRAAGL